MSYTKDELMNGIIIAFVLTLVGLVLFNLEPIIAIISTEGLLSE